MTNLSSIIMVDRVNDDGTVDGSWIQNSCANDAGSAELAKHYASRCSKPVAVVDDVLHPTPHGRSFVNCRVRSLHPAGLAG